MNIIKHSISEELESKDSQQAIAFGVNLGEIALNLTTKNIYTKLLDGSVVIVGKSIRNLRDFNNFILGSKSSNFSYSLVQFKYLDDIGLTLTTSYAYISIADITNVSINKEELNETYLVLDEYNKLVNLPEKKYNLSELADVDIISQLSSEYNNFVLTANYGYTNITKDPFISTLNYTWSLKPDASSLKTLDDIDYNQPAKGYLLKNNIEQVNSAKILRTSKLSIEWDKTPELISNLNCNLNYLFNLTYTSKYLELNNKVENVNCDFNLFSFYYIQCTDVLVITLNLNIAINFNDAGIKLNGIILNNFKGIIRFANTVEYENGIAPILIEDCNILSLLTYQDESITVTRVLHKGISLNGV